MPPEPPDDDGWTPYAPLTPPPNAGVCSWCSRRQTPDLVVLMSFDGSAGICEECVEVHRKFFARRRAERG